MSDQDFSSDLRSLISVAESLQSIGSDDAEKFAKFCNDLNACISQNNAMQSISDLQNDLIAGDFSDKISDFNGKYVLLGKIRRLLKDFEQSQNAIGNILSAIQYMSQNPVSADSLKSAIQYMSQNSISADSLKQTAERSEQIAERSEQTAPPGNADDDDGLVPKTDAQIETQMLDIQNPRAATNKSPVACAYKDTDIPFNGSWSNLLAELAKKICEENSSGFERLLKNENVKFS